MKIIITAIIVLFTFLYTNAQWAPLISGTSNQLNDVDFFDANNGLVCGNSGLLMITNNGGSSWNTVNAGTGNIGSVHMVSLDTFIISEMDLNNVPHLLFTYNSGSFWIPAFQDSLCFRVADSQSGPDGKWVTIGSSVLSSGDRGMNWDTLYQYTCSANNIDRLEHVDSCYNAGGLQSGFVTYSASMLRSEDAGNHFYSYDPFSFPNSDALTAFDFPNADTGYVFMNQYLNFAPGTRNSVVKVYNFALSNPFPGDTTYIFNSTVLDTTIPSYINDGKFIQQHGFAAGKDGVIYESSNGGTAWSQSYNNNGISLNRLSFPDSQTGYAVGDSGTILKYSAPNSVQENNLTQLSIYPNPASSYIMVGGMTSEKYVLTNLDGRNIQNGKMENGKINLNVPSGFYIVTVNKGEKQFRSRVIISNR